ncbi:thiopeptide-type bacteriocin biosynthesis protein [Streptomyces sp. NPDC102283]|uniref:thiopeptide-type bacteriocin biosynthesis protein n=1 Tax=Streptomyces sp. NPDC102283 TaxID=3366155 RepID=UPI0038178D2C
MEATAVKQLPVLTAQESELAQWSFLRKSPCRRLRYRHVGPDSAKVLDTAPDDLVDAGFLVSWTHGIYEPEEAAFEGPAAMEIAHALFHYDSRHVLNKLSRQEAVSSGAASKPAPPATPSTTDFPTTSQPSPDHPQPNAASGHPRKPCTSCTTAIRPIH